MSIPFMKLSDYNRDIRNEVMAKIMGMLETTNFIGGEEVAGFEKEFANFCKTIHAIGCGNGTDALILVLKALGIGNGDVVLTTPHTFIATSEAVTAVGARVAFVDIEEDTYTMSPQKLLEYVERNQGQQRIKAVIPVHLYGQMANMPQIMEIAKAYKLKVIEDAAQAHGAKLEGKGPGEYGEAATFSFFPGKNLGAFGDAGTVITNNEQLALTIKMLSNHGRTEKYKHQIEGYNSRLDSLQAAVLRVKLKYLEKWTTKRIENAAYYNTLLQDSDVITPVVRYNSKHVYHLYVIRHKNRDKLIAKLADSHISCGIHYPIPLHLQPAYRYLGYKEGDFPISERVSKEIISLPMWPELTKEQIENICRVIL